MEITVITLLVEINAPVEKVWNFWTDPKHIISWNNCVPEFNMPVRIYVSGEAKTITPSNRFSKIDLGVNNAVIVVDPNFYVASMNMTGK